MLRLEVGSKGLRADVPREREKDVEAFERADIVESWWSNLWEILQHRKKENLSYDEQWKYWQQQMADNNITI